MFGGMSMSVMDLKDKDVIFVRKVVGDGKITIPKNYREIYGIEIGDQVKVQILEVIKAPSKKR